MYFFEFAKDEGTIHKVKNVILPPLRQERQWMIEFLWNERELSQEIYKDWRKRLAPKIRELKQDIVMFEKRIKEIEEIELANV